MTSMGRESSEFNCAYCSNFPRHPCYSAEEVAKCPNAPDYQKDCIALYHVSAYIAFMAKRIFPIRLEDEMILDLTVYAATDQRSVSSLMRLILNEWLARRRPKEPT